MPARSINRRTFNTTAAGIAATAMSARRVLGANERLRLGFIGVGNRGSQLLDAFVQVKDVEIAAGCDVYRPYLDRFSKRFEGRPTAFADFRNLIDMKDLDGVVIATPDHWHAIMTVLACRAGKDVYVEKPLSITIREGRRMVEVARETKRVVQVGTHRRSSRLYARLASEVQADKVGKITVSRAYRINNMYP